MSRRRTASLVALLVLCAMLIVWSARTTSDTPRASDPPGKRQVLPAPLSPSSKRSAGAADAIRLMPPPDVTSPPERTFRAPPVTLTAEDRRTMNYAVDDVVRAGRDACLYPWLESETFDVPAEFVLDAVLFDGGLADMTFRAIGRDVPPDVVSCMADQVWYTEWPTWELEGELRLQRHFVLNPADR